MKNVRALCCFLVIFPGIIFLTSGQVLAATYNYLASSPLPRGDGGDHVCSCVNLSNKTMTLMITHKGTEGGLEGTNYEETGVGQTLTFTGNRYSAAYCYVEQQNHKPLNKNKVACTFSAVDSNGSPQAAVPVDKKFKRKVFPPS